MKKFWIPFLLLISSCSSLDKKVDIANCLQSPAAQTQASQELLQMKDQDQKVRTQAWDKMNVSTLVKEDQQRRARTQQMADAHCLSTAQDYAYAALIFQHGESSHDYHQALQWGLKSLELSPSSQNTLFMKSLLTAIADRYLVSIGQQQIFGTQYSRPDGSDEWCKQPVQKGVPEKFREEWLGQSLQSYETMLKKTFPITQEEILVCKVGAGKLALKPTPRGTLPPLW